MRVDAPCLDCGEPISIEMRDEEVLSVNPDGIYGYSYTAMSTGGDPSILPYR